MKLIHHGGYNEQERDSYKEIIYSNTIQSMRYVTSPSGLPQTLICVPVYSAILEAMPHLDIQLSPQNDARRSVVLSLPGQIEGDIMPRDVADSIRGLWKDPAVKEAVARSREFQLNDSAVYYFNAIDRMAAPNYMPTDQDILRSRVKTTGITETTFKVGELTYKLFDVGGQRSERKKWIHCFENVTALVFLVSLSEYDQMLYEDESVVRSFTLLPLVHRFSPRNCSTEPYAGGLDPVRFDMQLKMVRQDVDRKHAYYRLHLSSGLLTDVFLLDRVPL